MDLLGYTSLSSFSTADLIVGFVLAVVFAFIGYRSSHRFRLVVGVTPWRIPSIVWAAICFFLQPFGVILQWVAEFTTRPGLGGTVPQAPRQQPHVMGTRGMPQAPHPTGPDPTGPYPTGGYQSPPAPSGYPVAESHPGATYPAYPQQTPVAPVPPPGFAPPLDGQGRPAIFGWYPDPTRRHEQRYWDGRGWGDLVADGGTRSDDPIAR